MKRIKTLTVMAAGALALSALPQVASGTLSDVLTVYNGDGSINQLLTVSEDMEAQHPNNLWTLDHGIANPNPPVPATALVESDGTISDVFGVAFDGTGPVLAFMSGENLNVLLAGSYFGSSANWIRLLELPGFAYNATMYVNPNAGVSATFVSDVVPEPTTMIAGALLLLPFGASTLRILRKRQTA